jgi:teichuronic acid biosynthesis glycosyltransferase TuaG
MISIITPIYNDGKYIEETIRSVISQTYEDWEMIVIDDDSKDDGPELVQRIANTDSRIRLISMPENVGAARARNRGIEEACGRYIAFIDGDDVWKNEKLECQLDFMKRKKVGFSYTSYSIVSEDGVLLKRKVSIPNLLDYKGLLKNTAIGCSTVMIDKRVFGDFRMPDKRAGQDTATWLMLLRTGECAYGFDEILASYRLVKGSVSSNKFGALKRTWKTYRDFENLSLLFSIYCFIQYIFNASRRRYWG